MSEFSQRFVVLDAADGTALPFTASGLTQHGTSHSSEGCNNQDAMSLFINKEAIIGVLCDGCSSGSDIMALNPWSFAENGAQLLSILVGRHIQELWRGQDFSELAAEISQYCLADLKSLLNLLAGNRPDLREHLLQQIFMATILAVLITPEKYCVFHCGDGLVAINGKFTELNSTASGQYLANTLSCEATQDMPLLEVFQEGACGDLDNVLLASDGMSDLVRSGSGLLENMLGNLDTRTKGYTPGADKFTFLREFRKRVAVPFEPLSPKAYDDRSLLMIRRLPGCTRQPAADADNSAHGAVL